MTTLRSWKACWIWPRDRREPNLHLLVRKDFEVATLPERALLHLAVESAASIILNGHEIGRTAPNSYPHQHYYETFDCRAALRPGVNRLAIIARYIGIPSSASVPKDPGLLAELEMDGESVGSDATWLCLPLDAWQGRQRRSEWLNLDQIEIVDRRLLPPGFPYPDDATGFLKPEALAWPGVRFTCVEPRTFPKALPCGEPRLELLRAGTVADRSAEQPIPALAMAAEILEPIAFTWDGTAPFTVPALPAGRAFTIQCTHGDYRSGRPVIELDGPAGAVVDLAWDERFIDGRLDTDRRMCYTADRHILAAGANRIVPEDWVTGRVLQFTFRQVTAPIRVHRLAFIEEAYPLRQRLRFSSSDPRLERIVAISLQAVRRCMHDNIMDCPWRERRQWIGDVQRIALINHYAFGDRALVRAVLRQHIGMQDPSGRMWCCVPIWEEYPTQSMEWLRAVLEYGACTGDASLLDEVSPNVDLLHRWFLRHRDERGLLFIPEPPIINWMDNPFGRIRPWQRQVPFLAQNLRYLTFLDDMARVYAATGRIHDAQAAATERQALEARVRTSFTDQTNGLLRDCPDVPAPPRTYSVMGHALAVSTGLLPLDEAGRLWDAFQLHAGRHPEEIIPTSPFGQFHVHQALARLGRPDAIIADILAAWGPMVDAGAATTWEDFTGASSHCHGWGGIPVVSIAQLVLNRAPQSTGITRREGLGGVDWLELELT